MAVEMTACCPGCAGEARWIGRMDGNTQATVWEIVCARCDGWSVGAQLRRWLRRLAAA